VRIGLFYTIGTRFVQFRLLKDGLKAMLEKSTKGASAFAESTLAQVYKIKDKDGAYRGGPSYYMEKALGKRWMGVLFSVLLILCFAYGFNGLQSYNMSSALQYYFQDYAGTNIPMIVSVVLGLILAAAAAL